MGSNEIPNIAGGWLGTYYYSSVQRQNPPVRFDASFASGPGGQFSGTIVDDSRLLGKANVRGVQRGLDIRFIKGYQKVVPGGRTMRVEYEGSLSENGQMLRGTWRATGPCGIPIPMAYGTWDARRAWLAEAEPEVVENTDQNRHVMREAVLA